MTLWNTTQKGLQISEKKAEHHQEKFLWDGPSESWCRGNSNPRSSLLSHNHFKCAFLMFVCVACDSKTAQSFFMFCLKFCKEVQVLLLLWSQPNSLLFGPASLSVNFHADYQNLPFGHSAPFFLLLLLLLDIISCISLMTLWASCK